MYVYIYIYIMCICIYIYTYVYMYIYIYKHMTTRPPDQEGRESDRAFSFSQGWLARESRDVVFEDVVFDNNRLYLIL